VKHTADWWLGDLEGHWFKCLESAVQEEWGIEPLRIREGGVRYFLFFIFYFSKFRETSKLKS